MSETLSFRVSKDIKKAYDSLKDFEKKDMLIRLNKFIFVTSKKIRKEHNRVFKEND